MNNRPFWLALILLLASGGFFLGFSGSVDDAHITFWAAQLLGSEGKILNYSFEQVEQSSALLQVVLLAMLHAATHLPVVVLGHVITVLASVMALYFTGVVAQRIFPLAKTTALLLLATSPFFVYWSFSGMEGPLLALLLLGLLIISDKWLQQQKLFLVLALVSMVAQMTRPEMPIILFAFAASLFLARTVLKISVWQWRSLWLFLFLQVLCAALLTAWRWWYFHDLVPQPVNAKIGSLSLPSIWMGLQYFQQTWLDVRLALSALLVLTGAMLAIVRWRDPMAVAMVFLLFIYSAFVIASGGDWMAAGRFWVPVMPLASLLIALVLQRLFTRQWIRNALLLSVIAGNVLYLWRGTNVDFNGVPLWKKTLLTEEDGAENYSFFERHAREHLHDIPTLSFARPLIAKLLAARSEAGNRAPVNLMAGQMGMVPFYLATDFRQRLHFFDRNGITERTLTQCKAAAALPRTRNGIGTGYAWILENSALLKSECGFEMPDIVFDIEAAWNRRNIAALEQAGYVFVYRQRGHIFAEPEDALLPLRKIGAGQFIAVSSAVWEQLGSPAPVERVF